MGDKVVESGGGVGNKTNLRSKTSISLAAYNKMIADCGKRAKVRKEGETKLNISLSKGTSG
jgi:hypothetical protein